MVGNEALEVTDGNGFVTHFQMDTLRFALLLLRAYATADSRQRTGLVDDSRSLLYIAEFDLLDERRYIDVHGAAFDAARVLARQAAVALSERLFGCQAEVNLFVERLNTLLWCQFGHNHTGNSGALFGGQTKTPLRLSPHRGESSMIRI